MSLTFCPFTPKVPAAPVWPCGRAPRLMTVMQQRGKCHSGEKHIQDLPSPPFPRWLRSRPVSDESRMETVTGSQGMAKKAKLQTRKEKVQLFLITSEIERFCCDIQRNEKLQPLLHCSIFHHCFYWNHSPACQKMALYDCCCALRRVFNKISCCYLCLAGKPTHTYWSEQVLRRTGKKTLHRLSHCISHFSHYRQHSRRIENN